MLREREEGAVNESKKSIEAASPSGRFNFTSEFYADKLQTICLRSIGLQGLKITARSLASGAYFPFSLQTPVLEVGAATTN